MSFRSYVRHCRDAILGLLRPSLPWCFPIWGPAAAAVKASAAAGGKDSQNHHFLWVSGVTLGIFGVIRGPAAAAKASAAAGGKGSQIHSFSIGFRIYVRHFRGAILGLLRPSLPWCFPIRGPAAAAKPSAAAGGKIAKIHFLWLSDFTLGMFRTQFWGFPLLHCHRVFSIRGLSFEQQQQQEEIVAKMTYFYYTS